tara:strand:+ start:71 stop:757 length:687 start_codon:yes stop_codon:yes gene_type:complete
MRNLTIYILTSTVLLFSSSAYSNIDGNDTSLVYLACEYGKQKNGMGKFRTGPHTLNKLLKNEIKLPTIKKLRKYSRYIKDLKGMDSFRYNLISIDNNEDTKKAKLCRTTLYSLEKDNYKEECGEYEARTSEFISIYESTSVSPYSRIYQRYSLDRSTLMFEYSQTLEYRNSSPRYSNYAYQCYVSSLSEWNDIKVKFEETKEPIYRVLKEQEDLKKLEEERTKKNRKI